MYGHGQICAVHKTRKILSHGFCMVLKIYVELAGYGGYNGRIETKRRDGL